MIFHFSLKRDDFSNTLNEWLFWFESNKTSSDLLFLEAIRQDSCPPSGDMSSTHRPLNSLTTSQPLISTFNVIWIHFIQLNNKPQFIPFNDYLSINLSFHRPGSAMLVIAIIAEIYLGHFSLFKPKRSITIIFILFWNGNHWKMQINWLDYFASQCYARTICQQSNPFMGINIMLHYLYSIA